MMRDGGRRSTLNDSPHADRARDDAAALSASQRTTPGAGFGVECMASSSQVQGKSPSKLGGDREISSSPVSPRQQTVLASQQHGPNTSAREISTSPGPVRSSPHGPLLSQPAAWHDGVIVGKDLMKGLGDDDRDWMLPNGDKQGSIALEGPRAASRGVMGFDTTDFNPGGANPVPKLNLSSESAWDAHKDSHSKDGPEKKVTPRKRVLQTLEDEVSVLRLELGAIKDDAARQQRENEDLRCLYKNCEAERNEAWKKLERALQQLERGTGVSSDGLHAQIKELQESAEGMKEQLTHARAEKEVLELQVQQVQQILQEQSRSAAEVQGDLDDMTNVLAEARKKEGNLQEEIVMMRSEINNQRELLVSLEKDLQEAYRVVKIRDQEKEVLETDLQKRTADLNHKSNELETTRDSMIHLEAIISTLREEVSRPAGPNGSSQAGVALRQDLLHAKEEVRILDRQIKEANSELKVERASSAKLMGENDKLARQIQCQDQIFNVLRKGLEAGIFSKAQDPESLEQEVLAKIAHLSLPSTPISTRASRGTPHAGLPTPTRFSRGSPCRYDRGTATPISPGRGEERQRLQMSPVRSRLQQVDAPKANAKVEDSAPQSQDADTLYSNDGSDTRLSTDNASLSPPVERSELDCFSMKSRMTAETKIGGPAVGIPPLWTKGETPRLDEHGQVFKMSSLAAKSEKAPKTEVEAALPVQILPPEPTPSPSIPLLHQQEIGVSQKTESSQPMLQQQPSTSPLTLEEREQAKALVRERREIEKASPTKMLSVPLTVVNDEVDQGGPPKTPPRNPTSVHASDKDLAPNSDSATVQPLTPSKEGLGTMESPERKLQSPPSKPPTPGWPSLATSSDKPALLSSAPASTSIVPSSGTVSAQLGHVNAFNRAFDSSDAILKSQTESRQEIPVSIPGLQSVTPPTPVESEGQTLNGMRPAEQLRGDLGGSLQPHTAAASSLPGSLQSTSIVRESVSRKVMESVPLQPVVAPRHRQMSSISTDNEVKSPQLGAASSGQYMFSPGSQKSSEASYRHDSAGSRSTYTINPYLNYSVQRETSVDKSPQMMQQPTRNVYGIFRGAHVLDIAVDQARNSERRNVTNVVTSARDSGNYAPVRDGSLRSREYPVHNQTFASSQTAEGPTSSGLQHSVSHQVSASFVGGSPRMAHAGRLRTDVQSLQSKGYYANYAVSAAAHSSQSSSFNASYSHGGGLSPNIRGFESGKGMDEVDNMSHAAFRPVHSQVNPYNQDTGSELRNVLKSAYDVQPGVSRVRNTPAVAPLGGGGGMYYGYSGGGYKGASVNQDKSSSHQALGHARSARPLVSRYMKYNSPSIQDYTNTTYC